jgi:hypothetical protein
MYKFFFADIKMAIWIPFVILVPYIPIFNGIEVFNFWTYILLSGAYGAYIMLRVFYQVQYYNAKKIGMTYELDRINKIGKVKQ